MTGARAVFVDRSGRRAVVGRVLGLGVGVVVVAYLVAFGLSLLGVSWVPPVDLPVVGDALPAADAGTEHRATDGTTRALDASDRRDDTPDELSPSPVAAVPASVPAVNVPESVDGTAPWRDHRDGRRRHRVEPDTLTFLVQSLTDSGVGALAGNTKVANRAGCSDDGSTSST